MLLEDLVTYLNGKGYEAITTRFSELSGREGICIRTYSVMPIRTYYSGKQDIRYIYQVIVRKQFDELEAITLAEELQELVNSAQIVGNDYQFNGQTKYSLPQEMTRDESGFYAYEFKQEADLTI